MACTVARVLYKNDKNCFVVLPKELSKSTFQKESVQVYEIQYGKNDKAYVTQGGDVSGKAEILQINGIYCSKLGLKEDYDVVIRPIPAVSFSHRVSIEPETTDDWEILERHADFVEQNLLNQIRVVWKGQIFPFWADKIVLFLKISDTFSDEVCVVLNDDTEVSISPKVRNNLIGQKKSQSNATSSTPTHTNQNKRSTDSLMKSNMGQNNFDYSPIVSRKATSLNTHPNNYAKANPVAHHHHEYNSEPRVKKRSSWNPVRFMAGLFTVSGAFDTSSQFYAEVPEDEDYGNVDRSPSITPEREENNIQKTFGGLNFKLRVQSLNTDFACKNETSNDSDIDSCPDDFKSRLYLQQPNIVFVNSEDIQEQISSRNMEMPDTFYAKLTKLSSPKEIYARAEEQSANQKKEKLDKLDASSESLRSSRNSESKEKQLNCIVRVVVLTKKGLHSNPELIELISHLLEEQPCLRGHVIIPDLLRRLMKLDVTRQIWLQIIDTAPSQALAFGLQSVTSLPKSVGSYHIQEAFKKWVTETSSFNVPFVMFPGILIKVPVFKEVTVELQVLYHEQKLNEKDTAVYSLLNPENIEDLSFYIKNPTSLENSKWPILPMLAYMDIKSIDPIIPKEKFEYMGGIEELAEEAINSVEICLSSKPLSDAMFRKITPGLRNGMILITGPKGSGKTMFAQALLRKQAELPNLAYVLNVDCKPLRGKRPDTILKLMQIYFDEAAWRQPSVILLDDLEQVMPAPSGPEAEMSGEAVYGSRVAEALRDLLRKEVCDGSRIAVVATTVARNAIHPLLVNSRGTHYVQTTLAIDPPDKKRRKEIFESIIKTREVISPVTLERVDLDWLQCKTEGYVSSDLMNLVSRALHSYWLKYGHCDFNEIDGGIILNTEEFKDAIEGFTPASIRNVKLHTAGELGWSDVGGLEDIKNVLMETLQWPSKYPKLFNKCPLRLRSGLLLYGAPGTGKTLLAGVVAKECGLNFISIKGPELLNKYIGASEQAVRDTFIRAQSAKPCILFFDEFESMAPRRGHDNTGVTDRVVNQLLTQLDGVEGLEGVYVLAATSRPDLIDPALLRPGRLDKCLCCNIPNLEDRKAILKALTQKITLECGVDLDYFAEKCDNFTGADFKALLYNAQLEAIHEITGLETKKQKFHNYSPQRSPSYLYSSRRRSSSYRHLAKAAEMEREDKAFPSDLIYVRNLNEGYFELSEELEDHLSQQVKQIRNRLSVHKKTEKVTTAESLFSPVSTSKGTNIIITQNDLIKALDKTRPSVTGEERLKYINIYENFVSSRGGNFAQNIMDNFGQRQTCA